jgi:hypothetical protein
MDVDFLKAIQPSATKRSSGSIDIHDRSSFDAGPGPGPASIDRARGGSKDAYKDFNMLFDDALLVPEPAHAPAPAVVTASQTPFLPATSMQAATYVPAHAPGDDLVLGFGFSPSLATPLAAADVIPDSGELSQEAQAFLDGLPGLAFLL